MINALKPKSNKIHYLYCESWISATCFNNIITQTSCGLYFKRAFENNKKEKVAYRIRKKVTCRNCRRTRDFLGRKK